MSMFPRHKEPVVSQGVLSVPARHLGKAGFFPKACMCARNTGFKISGNHTIHQHKACLTNPVDIDQQPVAQAHNPERQDH